MGKTKKFEKILQSTYLQKNENDTKTYEERE